MPLTFHQYETGIRLAVDEAAGHLVVGEVEPYSQAAQDGLVPGMVVVSLNGTTIIGLPQEVYADPDPSDPNAAMPVTGVEPAAPTTLVSTDVLRTLAGSSVQDMEVILPLDLATGSAASGWATLGVFYPGWSRVYDLGLALVVGLVVFVVGSWWLVTGRSGRRSRASASPSPRPRPPR